MDRQFALGTTAFAILTVVLGLTVEMLIRVAGVDSALAGQTATFLVATPLSLLAARRLGRISHLSVLLASTVVAVATLWTIVFILNSVAEPAGGRVGWGDLLNTMGWRNAVGSTAAALLVPQVWLWVLNRLAANNSLKPKPLRGSV